jgi:hypothetical protein
MVTRCSARARVMIASFVLIQASTSQTSCDFKWRDAIGGLVVGMLGTAVVHKLMYLRKLRIADEAIAIVYKARAETGIKGFGIADVAAATTSDIVHNKLIATELRKSVRNNDDHAAISTNLIDVMRKIFPGKYGPKEDVSMGTSAAENGCIVLEERRGGKVVEAHYVPSAAAQSAVGEEKFSQMRLNASVILPKTINKAFLGSED